MDNRAHVLTLAILAIAALNTSCGDNSASPMAPITAGPAGSSAPSSGASGTAVAGGGGTASAAMAGSSAAPKGVTGTAGTRPAAAGSLGSAAGNGAGGAGSAAMGGAPAGGNGGAGDSAGAAAAGTGGASGSAGATAGATAGAAGTAGAPVVDIPAPVASPQNWGFGIGITDVPAAVKFYTDVMKMTVEKDAIKRDDMTETIMYGPQAMRGARVHLMKFDDMRNTRKITAKLVWQSQSASTVNRAASMHPDYVSRLNIGIVQFDGPETYVHEVGGSFDSGGRGITVPYPIALGFAVSDLAASRKFYTSLGMTESSIGTFTVTDANGTGSITEYSVKFTEGAGVVLQQWTPMRNTKDNPIKLVIFAPDAKAMADKVVAGGGTIVKQAERTPVYDNRLLIVAKDLDGYLLDLVQ